MQHSTTQHNHMCQNIGRLSLCVCVSVSLCVFLCGWHLVRITDLGEWPFVYPDVQSDLSAAASVCFRKQLGCPGPFCLNVNPAQFFSAAQSVQQSSGPVEFCVLKSFPG